jgi:hypothetical protein
MSYSLCSGLWGSQLFTTLPMVYQSTINLVAWCVNIQETKVETRGKINVYLLEEFTGCWPRDWVFPLLQYMICKGKIQLESSELHTFIKWRKETATFRSTVRYHTKRKRPWLNAVRYHIHWRVVAISTVNRKKWGYKINFQAILLPQ